ncbi:UNVERIFIED_CONTAM: hypothetical protein NCL1_03215 [Trichonephila clavipes]
MKTGTLSTGLISVELNATIGRVSTRATKMSKCDKSSVKKCTKNPNKRGRINREENEEFREEITQLFCPYLRIYNGEKLILRFILTTVERKMFFIEATTYSTSVNFEFLERKRQKIGHIPLYKV